MQIILRNFKFFIFLFLLSQNFNNYSLAHMRGTFLSEEEAEKTMLGKTDWWIYKPDGCPLGDWREVTDEERVADEKQAVADGRLNEKFASYT